MYLNKEMCGNTSRAEVYRSLALVLNPSVNDFLFDYKASYGKVDE